MTQFWQPELFARDAAFDAARWNAFVALAGAPVRLGRHGTSVTFQICEPPIDTAWCAALEVEGSRDRALAQLETFPFEAMGGGALTPDELPVLDDDLRRALLDGVLAVLLPAFELSDGGVGLGADGHYLAFRPEVTTGWEWLAVRIDGLPEGPASFRLGAPREAILSRLGSRPFDLAAHRSAISSRVSIPVDTTLGALDTTLSELLALEPGDVVVLPERPEDEVLLRVGDVAFSFRPHEAGYRTQGPQAQQRHRPTFIAQLSEATAMDDASQSGEGAEGEATATPQAFDPRMVVDFDLGRLSLPLSVVAGWSEGAVVEMERPRMSEGVPVTIRVNGEAVGQGDLVRIDERIAVRITSLTVAS